MKRVIRRDFPILPSFIRRSPLVLAPALALACEPMAPNAPDHAVDRIRAADASWLAAAARRDLDGMMGIYAPDAQELLPDMPALVGRDTIRAFYRGLIEQLPRFAHEFTLDDITVAASGDLAVVRGSYRFTPDTLEPHHGRVGKYVGVWRYRDDAWRLCINISNGNEPPPPSPTAGSAAP